MNVCACTGTFINGDPWLVPNEAGGKDTFCLLHGVLYDLVNLVSSQLGDDEGKDLIEAAERIMNGPCGRKAENPGKLLPELKTEPESFPEPKPLSDEEKEEERRLLAKCAPFLYPQNE